MNYHTNKVQVQVSYLLSCHNKNFHDYKNSPTFPWLFGLFRDLSQSPWHFQVSRNTRKVVTLVSIISKTSAHFHTGFKHCVFFKKWLQYLVVPSDAFNVRPSICRLLTVRIAANASSGRKYVTYALALGPYKHRQMKHILNNAGCRTFLSPLPTPRTTFCTMSHPVRIISASFPKPSEDAPLPAFFFVTVDQCLQSDSLSLLTF